MTDCYLNAIDLASATLLLASDDLGGKMDKPEYLLFVCAHSKGVIKLL